MIFFQIAIFGPQSCHLNSTRTCVFQVVYSIWPWFVLGDSFEDSDGGYLLDFIFQFIPFLYIVWQEALVHLFCGSSQLDQVIDSGKQHFLLPSGWSDFFLVEAQMPFAYHVCTVAQLPHLISNGRYVFRDGIPLGGQNDSLL